MVTCSFCDTIAGSAPEPAAGPVADDAADVPLTWTSSVEHGEQRWYCDDCSRRHLRAMEGKLDSEWW